MELAQQVQDKAKELEGLNALLAEYPDTKSWKDRWGRTVYVSASIPLDHPDLKHHGGRSCGCCREAAYQYHLYLEFGGLRISPEGWNRRTICYANDWSGTPDFHESSLRRDLGEKGLPERLIDSALFYLKAHEPDEEDGEE